MESPVVAAVDRSRVARDEVRILRRPSWRTLVAAAGALIVVAGVWMAQVRPGPYIGGPSSSPGIERYAPSTDDYLEAKTFRDFAGRDGQEVELAPGVRLTPGADGRLPVRPRWAVQLTGPEAFALHKDVVYVADEFLDAFRLSDGHLLWKTGDPDGESGLHADGGVYIGLDDADTVRAIAPYNYDIAADRKTGELRQFSYQAGPGAKALRPLPAPRPRDYRVEAGLDLMTARTPSGQVAWSIEIDEPWFESYPPIAIRGGLALLTSSGLLVVLDYQ